MTDVDAQMSHSLLTTLHIVKKTRGKTGVRMCSLGLPGRRGLAGPGSLPLLPLGWEVGLHSEGWGALGGELGPFLVL